MTSPVFTLVTSNQEKVFFARQALEKLGIPFAIHPVAVIEIQSENPEELIKHKANAAFTKLKTPVVVTDHWWEIPAIGGFPGPYMRFVNDHMKAKDLLRLMRGVTDRRVFFTECICYQDENRTHAFFERMEGQVLRAAAGKGLPGQQVYSLSHDGKSIAEHLNSGTDPRMGHERKVWSELAAWLSSLS